MKTYSENHIGEVAAEVIQKARQAPLAAPDRAVIITLSGDLGAGKTTLAKEIARQLGVIDDLQSPTYVIYKKYEIPNLTPALPLAGEGAAPWKRLIHGDMYRLESADDIRKLGWDELVSNPENILIIEWPEMVAGAIPETAIRAVLTHAGESLRNIDF